jgi:hypothetical protein
MAVQVQTVKNKPVDELRMALSTQFPPGKVNEIFIHYDTLTRSAQLGDYEKCLVNGGKFVEAVLKCLHYRRTQTETDSLKAEEEVKALENATSLDISERMTIPRTLRLIYEHRNKRGGAHNTSFDPNEMDSVFVVAAAKWVMEELTRLYLMSNSQAASTLVANLLVKEIPLVEEIDDDFVILRPGLSARIQLEILLYKIYPARRPIKDLIAWIKQNHSEHNVRVTLGQMKIKALVHENADGWMLTAQGVHEAETELAKIELDASKAVGKTAIKRTKMRGTKRGRK